MTVLAAFGFGGSGGERKAGGAVGDSVSPTAGPLLALLLVRGALLGGRVVQAHVLLAGSPADHAEARGQAPAKLRLLGGLGGVAWLGEVLRREKRSGRLSKQVRPLPTRVRCCLPNLLTASGRG